MNLMSKNVKKTRSLKKSKALLNILNGNGSSPPIYLKLDGYLDYLERINVTISLIKKSRNPRLIILETWLILDFTLRHLLLRGLELDRFYTEDDSILPLNFRDCLKIFEEFILEQNKKPVGGNIYNQKIDFPLGFIDLIYTQDKKFFDKLTKFEHDYLTTLKPATIRPSENLQHQFAITRSPEIRQVDEHWLSGVNQLNEGWIDFAKKLNEVRNKAVHSFNDDNIYIKMGIAVNDNAIKNLRIKCLEFLSVLHNTK